MLHRELKTTRAKLISSAVFFFLLSSVEIYGDDRLQKFKASAIQVLDGSATMYQHKNYYITQSSGPVGKEGIPNLIRLGDIVEVKGKRIKVNFIFVTRYLTDLKSGGKVLAHAGDIKCVIVETEKDLPYGDEYRDRLWINVEQCKPIQ
jgi:hypothetical protein